MEQLSYRFILLALVTHFTTFYSPVASATPRKIEHVVVMVFDQMRPEYPEKFSLKTLQELKKQSTWYDRAWVGHLPAITVISHPVIATGKTPATLPIRDTSEIDANGETVNKARSQIEAMLPLIESLRGGTLASDIKRSLDGKVFAVGQKEYAVSTMGTADADSLIALSRSKDEECRPAGINVPDYIVENTTLTFPCPSLKTPGTFFDFPSNEFFPFTTPYGGDRWVSTIASEIIKKEPWSGLLLTFGGIDKVGHWTGELDSAPYQPGELPLTLEKAAHIADAALQEVLSSLEKAKIADKTLIIITADHGGQTDTTYLGTGKDSVFTPKSTNTPFWIKQIFSAAEVSQVIADTAIRVWLKDAPKERALLEATLARISGVEEIYRKDADRYNRLTKSKLSPWGRAHYDKLLATTFSATSADYWVMLKPGVGFDLLGDHGGAQENVQRIPFLVYDPSSKPRVSHEEKMLRDVRGIIGGFLK